MNNAQAIQHQPQKACKNEKGQQIDQRDGTAHAPKKTPARGTPG
jgi:hypothetical protein